MMILSPIVPSMYISLMFTNINILFFLKMIVSLVFIILHNYDKSACQFVGRSIFLSISLSLCSSRFLFVLCSFLSVYPSDIFVCHIYLFTCLSCLSVCLSIHLSSICKFVRVTACLSHLLSIYLYLHWANCLHIFLTFGNPHVHLFGSILTCLS